MEESIRQELEIIIEDALISFEEVILNCISKRDGDDDIYEVMYNEHDNILNLSTLVERYKERVVEDIKNLLDGED